MCDTTNKIIDCYPIEVGKNGLSICLGDILSISSGCGYTALLTKSGKEYRLFDTTYSEVRRQWVDGLHAASKLANM